jgi:hypothetical protein
VALTARFAPLGSFQSDAAPAIRKALITAAAQTAIFAAARCPVSPGEGGGKTRASIRASASFDPPEAYVTVGGAGVFIEKGTAAWTSDNTVHFVADQDGTYADGTPFSAGDDIFVAPGYEFAARPPRPFMRPALLTDLPRWLAAGGR